MVTHGGGFRKKRVAVRRHDRYLIGHALSHGTVSLFSTEPRKIETVSRTHCPPDCTTRMMLSPDFA